jgi:hypothetical protein
MDVKPLPPRRGRPLCVTVDYDAEQLLRAMAPNGKSFGYLVSELLRKEARERDQRAALLDRLRTHHDADPGSERRA